MKKNDQSERVFRNIEQYHNEHGYMPSLRDLMKLCQFRSTSVAAYYLKKLERFGWIQRDAGKSRAYRITRQQQERRKIIRAQITPFKG